MIRLPGLTQPDTPARRPRRAIPPTAGLPRALLRHPPLGLALALLSVIFAAALFADLPMLQFGEGLDPHLRAVFAAITRFGMGDLPILLSLALLLGFTALGRNVARVRDRVLWTHAAAQAGYVLAVVAGSGLVVNLLKFIIGRARPQGGGAGDVLSFAPFAGGSAWASFPSGHATTVFGLAVALASLMPRHRLTFLLVAFWIALSRILLGAHWTSDVIAGAALGTASALTLRWWFACRGWAFVWRNARFDARHRHLGPHLTGSLRTWTAAGLVAIRLRLASWRSSPATVAKPTPAEGDAKQSESG